MISTVTGRGELLNLRGEMVPVFRLRRVLGLSDEGTENGLLIIVEDQTTPAAFWVDDLWVNSKWSRNLWAPGLAKCPGVSGGAILGDGKVGLILDPGRSGPPRANRRPMPLPVKADDSQ
jgi:two-component system chemotaxis sensor kinase CheA